MAFIGVALPFLTGALECPSGKTYSLVDMNWTAAELWNCTEAARSRLRPVRFYMYSTDDLGTGHGDDEANALGNCAKDFANAAHGGEYHFILQLRQHPWRVRDPSMASVIVVPVFFSAHPYCPHYKPKGAMARVVRHDLWRSRRADHLIVATHFGSTRSQYNGNTPFPTGVMLGWFESGHWKGPRGVLKFVAPYNSHGMRLGLDIVRSPLRKITFFFGGQASRARPGYATSHRLGGGRGR